MRLKNSEITNELSTINILMPELSIQAGSPDSLLNRRGASRRVEILSMCENLMTTLEKLQAVYRKYQNMGRNGWRRVGLGSRDLTALRTKLTLPLQALDGFVNSLTMASVSRTEPMIVEILGILKAFARGHGLGAQSLLGAQSSSGPDDNWDALERELEHLVHTTTSDQAIRLRKLQIRRFATRGRMRQQYLTDVARRT